VGGKALLHVGQVCGHGVEAGSKADPFGEVVRPPAGEKPGVEGIGKQLRIVELAGQLLRFAGEPPGPQGVSAERPAAGQRRRQPAPRWWRRGGDVGLV